MRRYLKEPADCLFVVRPHGDDIFIEPEEWPIFTRRWLGVRENTKKLKEETTSAFCILCECECVCVREREEQQKCNNFAKLQHIDSP